MSLERTLALFRWYFPLSRVHFSAPVFFLFFAERVPLHQILELSAIYYGTVVLLEVPSGYFSDRVGRRATLLVSSAGLAVAYAVFLSGQTFAWLAFAQMCLAVGYSFLSGTDAALHYDTLVSLERGEQFEGQQARWSRNAYLAASGGTLLGGAVAVADLRLAYALALVNALVMFGLVWAMREPTRHAVDWASHGFAAQLAACARLLRSPALAWILAYVILQLTIEHVPYEFQQPYVATVLGELPTRTHFTPLATGAITATVAFVGSLAAARSLRLRAALGLGGALLLLAGVSSGLIACMALLVHPLVVPLLALRSVQPAAANVLVNVAVAPRVPQAQRATYLSLHSLAGRLGYAGVLWSLSLLAGGRSIDDPAAMEAMLEACAWLAVAGLAALALTMRALRATGPPSSGAGHAGRLG